MKRIAIALAAALLGSVCVAERNAPPAELGKIIVPEVDFRDTAMSDVVEFLALSSVPIGEPFPKVEQTVTQSHVTYRITWTGKREPESHLPRTGPLISLQAKEIPLLELFKKVAVLAGGSFKMQDGMMTIETRRGQQPPAAYRR